jgi:hypothetical protein
LRQPLTQKSLNSCSPGCETLMSRFRKGDLDGALSVGGKSVEHTLRALEFLRIGSAPSEIKSPQQTVKEIEKAQYFLEGLPVLNPRIADSMMYDVCSKRGALLMREIDPRRIDASLSAQAAS